MGAHVAGGVTGRGVVRGYGASVRWASRCGRCWVRRCPGKSWGHGWAGDLPGHCVRGVMTGLGFGGHGHGAEMGGVDNVPADAPGSADGYTVAGEVGIF